MREEFVLDKKEYDQWLAKFKEMAGCEEDGYFLKCYRTSKWQVEINLQKSELSVKASWKVNIRTHEIARTL